MTGPERKPTKEDMRMAGRVAAVVLVCLAVFTALFVWIGG
jgi:hypothetical protein